MMIKILTFLAAALTSLHAYAGLSVAEFENKSKTLSTNTYLLGLSSGLNTSNKQLSTINQVPLFCYPPYLNLTINDYREMIVLARTHPGLAEELERVKMYYYLLKKQDNEVFWHPV